MTKEQLVKDCLAMPDSTLSHPYGKEVDVIKNGKGKSFALIGILATTDVNSIKKNCDPDAHITEGDIFITLKFPQQLIYTLRDQYKSVFAGYYSNKDHWNTIILNKDCPYDEIKKFISISHDMVTPKK